MKTMKFLLLLFLFAPLFVWGQGSALDYGNPNLLEPKKFKNPIREVSVIVTEDGYFPNKISVFENEQVRFFITSSQREPSCFLLGEHQLFLAAHPGKVSEGTIIFNKSGVYPFYCPSSKHRGSLTVLKKEDKNKIQRKIASTPSFWMPRDY